MDSTRSPSLTLDVSTRMFFPMDMSFRGSVMWFLVLITVLDGQKESVALARATDSDKHAKGGEH